MKNKKQAVEEMAKDICRRELDPNCATCYFQDRNCRDLILSEKLYKDGYRKSTDVAREIFAEIDESFSQMIEEAENTIADAIQEENKSTARIAQYGRDVLILARNTLEKMLKKKYESEGADDEN